MSPDLEKTYGGFDRTKLKSMDFDKVFKDTKSKIRDAKIEGALKSAFVIQKEKTELDLLSEKNKVIKNTGITNYGDDSDAANNYDSIEVKNPKLEDWKSLKGKTIKAKLLRYADRKYQFQLESGKIVKVPPSGLSRESQERAEKMIDANSQGAL